MKALKVKEGSYWIGDPSAVDRTREDAIASFSISEGTRDIVDLTEKNSIVGEMEVPSGLICLFDSKTVNKEDSSIHSDSGLFIYFRESTSIGKTNSEFLRVSDSDRDILFEIQ